MDGNEKCASCGGVYHESTGHRHSEKSVICGPCAIDFKAWYKGMMARKFGTGKRGTKNEKVSFYDAAGKWKFWFPEGSEGQ